ncbi:MAG TPA: VWA domain-containing protein [Gemmataceae bacterium]|jgi:Ca-activated chloride channel family protein
MPDFAHLWLLHLLALAPLAGWAWLRRRRSALRYSDVRLVADLPAGRSRRARLGGAGLRAAGLAALVVALAGPRWPDPGTRLPAEGIAVVVALDVSGSMAEPDFDWHGERVTRLEAAKRALRLFVQGGEAAGTHLPGRGGDQVGLVAFAVLPEDTCPLTLSHDVLLELLAAEEPRGLPDTGTNIGDAIAWGLKKLDAAGDRRKVLVLLSDGEHNVPPPALTPRQAGQLAANRGVPVYAIDAGPPPAANAPPEEAQARATGQRSLQAVAALTGGRAFAAHDAAALVGAVAEIDRLERRPVQSFQYRRYAEAYPWCGLAALACFAAALGLERTAWRRAP